ncbi:hypothetical protein CKO28_02735 [Rhodovibrio sodomensis]|uniref:Uncharacterized protein n=2 Tax=Rhodovibrio sodomensis TaxID=1088 RepID=A0ABS1D9R8_9PROT|nr:hypothetical protein [Rhodovibrio sodomensis]
MPATGPGFAIERHEVVFNRADGNMLCYRGAPVGLLLDASCGFVSDGKVEDLQNKRLLMIAGARQLAPKNADRMARDLVILEVEPTQESVDRANKALHNQHAAKALAEALREGRSLEVEAAPAC